VTNAGTSVAMVPEDLVQRPQRADARRNYEKLLNAAREAFADGGSATSLEDIARRAGVGIGTLYRHFPTRQALFEAVYVNEVNNLCHSAEALADLQPWDAFVAWLHQLVAYIGTKRALAEELMASHDKDSEFFTTCRTALYTSGEPLLERAQQAGMARTDATIDDAMKLISGITLIRFAEPEQVNRVLNMAIDGLRQHPSN
jgi:AcrR family transcriptional regulator